MSEKPLKQGSEKKEGTFTIRVFILYVFVVLASMGIMYKVIDLQFFHKAELIAKAETKGKKLKAVEIPVEKGTIFSRDNEPLIKRRPSYKIAIDVYPVEKIDSVKTLLLSDKVFYDSVAFLADSLTKVFGATNPSWEQKLRTAREKKNKYLVISAEADVIKYLRIQTFPLIRMSKYHILCKPEINLNYVEYYYEDLARRTLGNTGEKVAKTKDMQGRDSIERVLVGIEGFFDKELTGTPGKMMKKHISNTSMDIKSEENIPPRPGYDVTTTLDMTIQDIANRALLKNLSEFDADEGCVVVMEVATGDVLAMVNISRDNKGKYRETFNHALSLYEPGSTFKTASLLVALDDGKVTPNTTIPLNYKNSTRATVGHRDVRDDHALAMNNPELWYVFAQSSNVGTSRTIFNYYGANKQQEQRFIDGLYRFGFNDTLHFPVFGGDIKPEVKNTANTSWSKMTISTIPYGYEVRVTPLHLLTFYNAIANDGCMVKPRLVSKITSKDSLIKPFQVDTLIAQICSEQALQYIRGMLDSVVTCGTARKGFLGAPYTVAGKTGTSKINDLNVKGQDLYNSSFVGYFPADKPKYSCIVVIKKSHSGKYYGGAVALPVFRDIADKIYTTDYKLMTAAKPLPQNADVGSIPVSAKVRPQTLESIFKGINVHKQVDFVSDWVKVYNDGEELRMEKVVFSKNAIPDVRNMSLTDAIYIMEKAGIKTEVTGYGRVKKQTPEANTPLRKNQKVVLELDIKG